MDDKLKAVVAGGKTGGHLFPALALVKEIENRYKSAEIVFFGTRNGIEAKIIPEMGYKIEYLWLSGLQRTLTAANLLLPFKMIGSILKCFYVLLRIKPDIVIGTGGYVSAPVVLTAALLRYPTMIQEQNSYPGITTRLLSRVVGQVHLSFEESVVFLKNKDKLYVSGNPVRPTLKKVDPNDAYSKFKLDRKRKTLLIFGGSQGAHSINLAAMHHLDAMMRDTDWQILWGTGESDYADVQSRCSTYGTRITAMPFISDMAAAYTITNLVVSRAGATTLAELQSCGLPAVLVPYPFAAEGHQEANARSLVSRNAAKIVLDSELLSATFMNIIMELIEDEKSRKELGSNLAALAKPDAAKDIIDKMTILMRS